MRRTCTQSSTKTLLPSLPRYICIWIVNFSRNGLKHTRQVNHFDRLGKTLDPRKRLGSQDTDSFRMMQDYSTLGTQTTNLVFAFQNHFVYALSPLLMNTLQRLLIWDRRSCGNIYPEGFIGVGCEWTLQHFVCPVTFARKLNQHPPANWGF